MRLTFDRRLDPLSSAPVAVAFSGGPDSYEALRRTMAATSRWVVALHVDHGLNPASADWAHRAEALAGELKADFRLLRWEGEKPATGLPAAARAARHALLADAARAVGAKVIVTGHTADDALENAVMGLGALAEWSPSPAWPEGRGLFLLRPLLQERRADIRAGLAPEMARLIDDPANADLAHPRIAARATIAGGGLAPDVANSSAEISQAIFLPGGAIRLPRAGLSPRLLAAALASAGGRPGVPRRDRVLRLLETLRGREARAATLAGAKLLATGGEMLIVRDAGETARGGLVPLHLRPGETGVFDGRFEITAAATAVEVLPLKGLARRLPREQQTALRGLPAAARPALPVIATKNELSCPILAGVEGSEIRSLVRERFLAACGAIAHEGVL